MAVQTKQDIHNAINNLASNTANAAANKLGGGKQDIRDIIANIQARARANNANNQATYATRPEVATPSIEPETKEAEVPKAKDKSVKEEDTLANVWQYIPEENAGIIPSQDQEPEVKLAPSIETSTKKPTNIKEIIDTISKAKNVAEGAEKIFRPQAAAFRAGQSGETTVDNAPVSETIADEEQEARNIDSNILANAGNALAAEMGKKGFIDYILSNYQPNAVPAQMADPNIITETDLENINANLNSNPNLEPRDWTRGEEWQGGVGAVGNEGISGDSDKGDKVDSGKDAVNDLSQPWSDAYRNAMMTMPFRTQRAEYYDWLANTDEGRQFAQDFADYANEDYGYTALRASGDTDAWAKLLGLTGEEGNEGIQGFKNRYKNAGVDLDSADALNNLMNYLYGDNSVDLMTYMMDDNYRRSIANEADAIADAGRYLAEFYNWGPGMEWAVPAGLDLNDMGMLALAHEAEVNGWNPMWGKNNVNNLMGLSGDQGVLAFADPESDEYKNNKRTNATPGRYSATNIINGLANEGLLYTGEGVDSPIYADIVDTLLKSYNDSHDNTKLVLR